MLLITSNAGLCEDAEVRAQAAQSVGPPRAPRPHRAHGPRSVEGDAPQHTGAPPGDIVPNAKPTMGREARPRANPQIRPGVDVRSNGVLEEVIAGLLEHGTVGSPGPASLDQR
eukprot:8079129-Heterocapsa_arctica.AAC.1